MSKGLALSYPPQPPHAYGQGGYGGQPIEHPEGTTVLVLGILSLVCCGILGPFAWIKGNNVIREIDMSGQFYANRGNINAGRICGIVATVLLIASVVIYGGVLATAVLLDWQ